MAWLCFTKRNSHGKKMKSDIVKEKKMEKKNYPSGCRSSLTILWRSKTSRASRRSQRQIDDHLCCLTAVSWLNRRAIQVWTDVNGNLKRILVRQQENYDSCIDQILESSKWFLNCLNLVSMYNRSCLSGPLLDDHLTCHWNTVNGGKPVLESSQSSGCS